VRPGERRQRSGDSYDLVWIDHQIQNLVPWADVAPRMARQRPRRLIIRLIIQTIRRDRFGSVWTDEAPNLSSPDRSGATRSTQSTRLRIWRGLDHTDFRWLGFTQPYSRVGRGAPFFGTPFRPSYVCPTCGALIATSAHERHIDWHVKIGG
jgi:hypothetical protein